MQRTIPVLLLEDDFDDKYLIGKLLEKDPKHRFSMSHITCIQELSDAFEQNKPDLILLDLNLSDISGVQTLLMCKEVVGPTPIIVVSGLDDEEYGEKLIQLGAQDFIPKAQLTTSQLIRAMRFSMERSQLVEAFKNKAMTDELTLLHNRRAIQEKLATLQYQYHHSGQRFALILIDLNNFKPINDNLGHQSGDEVLKQVAKRLKSHSRRRDMVARIGGDEFAILIPEFDSEKEVISVANNKAALLNIECYLLVEGNLVAISPTASFGIAIYPDDASGIDELYDCADKAMYRAKQSSKHTSKVVMYQRS